MLLPIQRLLAFMPGGLLVGLSDISVEQGESGNLVLDADGKVFVFDKSLRAVFKSGNAVASFPSIEAINIEHFTNGKRFEWWTLNLSLKGGKRLRIGRSVDDSKVSVAAARVANVVGQNVRVVQRVGL